ncbi:activity regulator of membrane protease YbbK [Pseudoalteromonas luteoviolacea]|uniref:Activity regulator of membrane protease YbbK n=1 Tax=Pseudoalteromonas luteoviolacea TaxID=43657 RepID=A0A1C0TSD3_9GAMM|nr:NfeD family protein [Pseudoalteromonas luteoviolacea]MBQ4810822.1 NfeD family protein [Pseudoalteromonas luteoviolacea]OCQ22163.1 activity regulator of membrane protease YbbK [Pseudoalteromonas luteoviolacea]
MELLSSNLPQTLIVMGLIALCVEVIVLGFATFVLFFLGLSLIISGTFMHFGVFEPTLLNALWINALITSVLAAVLWKPLKNMQEQQESKSVNSDFADLQFTLEQNLSTDSQVYYQYSGIEWQLKSKSDIPKGTHVKVVEKSVGILWVEKSE